VHHSATPRTATATTIARYHVETLRWPTIGYTWVIYPNGTIARCLHLSEVGYHVAGKATVDGISVDNWRGVGICLIGTLTKTDPPTPAQLVSLEWLLVHLDTLTVQADLPSGLCLVRAHREGDFPTECPGDGYRTWLDPIRLRRQKGGI
jgi:hypothetical protein